MLNLHRRENVLKNKPCKGNLGKTKGWCGFCREKFEIRRCAGLQLGAFKSFELRTVKPQK